VTAKRGGRVARPAKDGEWTPRHASSDAADGWETLCRQQPGVLASFYDRVIVDPRRVDNPNRQGRLKGTLASAAIRGRTLEQWQHEIAGGGRTWYAVDDDSRVVWITKATSRHPNETK